MDLGSVRAAASQRLNGLSNPIRILVILALCLIAGIVLLWLFNQVFYYYLARSYVDEISDSFNLNRGFATALIWISFALIVVLSGWAFSLSKNKRNAGYAGLLALLVAHSVTIGMADKNFKSSGQAEKCFVMERNNVKIMNRVGIDPDTGRECRALTTVMAEKIELYKTGKRPTRITSNNPAFFSAISGEPVVWYAADKGGSVELYDLMGYHPQTAEELRPVTPQVVETWKEQNDRTAKRIPVRIDPKIYAFFDPMTGAARVWYWRSQSGEWEFYDGPGFHARTGEPLKLINRDVIAEWNAALEAAEAKKKADAEQATRDARERAAAAEREARERSAAEQRAREAELEAAKEKQLAGAECDRLAANPTDAKRAADGVPFDQLKGIADQAIEACTRATQVYPDEKRYLYQLGRATYFRDKKRASEIFTTLVSARYAAAFDNLGSYLLYDKRDMTAAIPIFKQGIALGDADSMVTLADLMDKGYVPQTPSLNKWALLNSAAQLSHSGAQKAVAKEKTRLEAEDDSREAARQAGEIFKDILLGGVRR